jgi:hypothetical protein
MSNRLPVAALALREEVKVKYRAVAVDPRGGYHFHGDVSLPVTSSET